MGFMRTNIVIDDELMINALKVTGLSTKKDVVEEGLKPDQYQMLGHEMVISCADYYRSLHKKGLPIRKTADVIIATFWIENRLPLLFSDRDFAPFVEHCGLQEVRP